MAAPGSAISGQFNFSTATISVAPQTSIKAINPAVHSIGLTKSVRVESSPQVVDLTQGIRQDVVASVTNRMSVTAGAEVFEYTAKNLMYGLGMDGSSLVTAADAVQVDAAVAAAATSITVGSDVSSTFTASKWGFIQDDLGDKVYVFKIANSAFAAGKTTITMAATYAIPATMGFSATARVGTFNHIKADPNLAQGRYFSVSILGLSIKDQRPLVVVFPKARITKGFGLAFNDSSFSNLPFEFSPMVPLPSDVGYDTDFNQIMHVFTP